MAVVRVGRRKGDLELQRLWLGLVTFQVESIGVKMLTPKTFSGLSFREIDNDKDVAKDRNLSTFKMYCKRRKSGVRFPDRKGKTRLCVIALLAMGTILIPRQMSLIASDVSKLSVTML